MVGRILRGAGNQVSDVAREYAGKMLIPTGWKQYRFHVREFHNFPSFYLFIF